MEYRNLGKSGMKVSCVGLGTNNFGGRMDKPSSALVLDKALELGINFIDTSNSYGRGLSEEYIGDSVSGKRHEYIIATKAVSAIGEGANQRGASRFHLINELEKSLRRLKTDYVDLYQMHYTDPTTPIEETLRALDDMVHQGKVRYIGCSNYASWQLCEAVWTSKMLHLETFVSVQPDYSMLNREIEKELLPFCEEYGVGVLPFYPLASGFLTGKYRPGKEPPEGTRLAGNERSRLRLLTDKNFSVLKKLEQFASERGHPLVELAIAWLLFQPRVSSVIAGATKPEQLDANANATEWELTAEEMRELDSILSGESEE